MMSLLYTSSPTPLTQNSSVAPPVGAIHRGTEVAKRTDLNNAVIDTEVEELAGIRGSIASGRESLGGQKRTFRDILRVIDGRAHGTRIAIEVVIRNQASFAHDRVVVVIAHGLANQRSR